MTTSESDSSDEEPRKKRGKAGRKRTDPKNNANGAYMCNACGTRFKSRNRVYGHLRVCEKSKKNAKSLKCVWCNLEFANRGNLATHAYHIHGDNSYRSITRLKSAVTEDLIKCNVCNREFQQKFQLKYHIRRVHFNLKAKIPYAEMKKVNQVWFEKVLNSNNIIEIKKTGVNTLVMRKLKENTGIKINDEHIRITDVSHLYPTENPSNKVRVTCDICEKDYVKRDYKKHFEEFHMDIRKHHCNNCNRSFKRAYHYLQHNCHKKRKIKGVRQCNAGFRISSVESLSIPLG